MLPLLHRSYTFVLSKRDVTFRNDKAKILTNIIRFGYLHPVTVKIIPAIIKAGEFYSYIIQPGIHKFLIGAMIFFPLESHFCFSVSFTKKPKRNMRLGLFVSKKQKITPIIAIIFIQQKKRVQTQIASGLNLV